MKVAASPGSKYKYKYIYKKREINIIKYKFILKDSREAHIHLEQKSKQIT